jgi:hypothetical protein
MADTRTELPVQLDWLSLVSLITTDAILVLLLKDRSRLLDRAWLIDSVVIASGSLWNAVLFGVVRGANGAKRVVDPTLSHCTRRN